MGSAADVAKFTDPTALGTSPTIYTYAGIDVTWPKPCRFLRAQTAGSVVYVDYDGTNKTAKFLAGETRALGSLGIVASGTGPASGDIEGMV
jgi:hypothetical protein